jgi:hypothetical protein
MFLAPLLQLGPKPPELLVTHVLDAMLDRIIRQPESLEQADGKLQACFGSLRDDPHGTQLQQAYRVIGCHRAGQSRGVGTLSQVPCSTGAPIISLSAVL